MGLKQNFGSSVELIRHHRRYLTVKNSHSGGDNDGKHGRLFHQQAIQLDGTGMDNHRIADISVVSGAK